MSESEHETQNSGFNVNDVLFILFRHKWKILLCAMAGLAAAAAVYYLAPSLYESQAKLLVRYVVDRSAVDRVDSSNTVGSQSENLINSEVEILTSWDLAMQVAEAVGVERLLPGAGGAAAKAAAAHTILQGLEVAAIKETSIISVVYRNRDPELAVQVLQELVKRYFDKHLEIHRSGGAFEVVRRETDRLRAQLKQTEAELKQLKDQAGIVSLPESTATVNAELARTQGDLDAAETELAAEQARVNALEKSLAVADSNQSEKAAHRAGSEVVRKYQGLVARVGYLRQMETELLTRYTSTSPMLKVQQVQLADLEKQRQDLEQQFPDLVNAASSQGGRPDLVSERARLVGIQARMEALRSRLSELQPRAKALAELGLEVAELQRKKDVEETNYKYYEASLEKARIDETLDPSRMPNISVVQKPSAALRTTRDLKKVVLGFAGGGPALGIALALLIEVVLDQSVKRRLDLEGRLRLPLLLSIPYFRRNGQLRLRSRNAGENPEAALEEGTGPNLAPWESGHFIRPFCEAIRDRLMLYFERKRMTHKPKLVAVAACSDGAGASTIAAGLAASLSEACDGKVLLVDKQFDSKRFYDLITEFKASDFDYVIFDMPSLSNTSATPAMAGFMDKVLLVVEAEVTNRDSVKRAFAELATANANVSAVLNKWRSYGPKWLQAEF